MPPPASLVQVDTKQRVIHLVVVVVGQDWRPVLEGIHGRMLQPEPVVPMGAGAYLHVPLALPIAEYRVEIHLYAGTIDGALTARADGLLLAGAPPADFVLAPRLSALPTAMLAATNARADWSARGSTQTPAFTGEDATGKGVAALRAVTKGMLHRLSDEGALGPAR